MSCVLAPTYKTELHPCLLLGSTTLSTQRSQGLVAGHSLEHHLQSTDLCVLIADIGIKSVMQASVRIYCITTLIHNVHSLHMQSMTVHSASDIVGMHAITLINLTGGLGSDPLGNIALEA